MLSLTALSRHLLAFSVITLGLAGAAQAHVTKVSSANLEIVGARSSSAAARASKCYRNADLKDAKTLLDELK